MKYVLIVLLALFTPQAVSAQKHHLWVDVSLPPGFSATYNYTFAKHINAGGGFQAYRFAPPGSYTSVIIPALYGDVRLNIRPEKKNRFFVFMNVGMNFYKQDKSYYRDSTTVYHYPHNNGFYTGLSFGYFRKMTKRGGGAYVSLKIVGNWYTFWGHSIVAERQDVGRQEMGGTAALSFGFKF